MRYSHLILAILLPCSAVPLLAEEAKLPPSANRKVDFLKDVRPLFARHCYSCHGADEQESNFRLDQPKIAFAGGDSGDKPIVVNKSADSPLVQLIAGVDPNRVMPPKGPRLTAAEIGLIRAWIDQGADWPADAADKPLATEHWSYQPLRRPEVPKVAGAELHPIDAFILAKLHEKSLAHSSAADRVTLIRRLYLDVLGLPPSPEQIAKFVADKDPRAYERLVDDALASPHYGERWARHWLDVIRFAETNGFETNVERPNAWRFRDYVIESLNQDKPYDQFVFEQLAGDTVGADVATGFIVGGPWDQVKSPDPVLTANQRADELADMTNTTGATFLGMTVGCARCHNHKFDPILQTDYYALQAVFAGVQHGERPLTPKLTAEQQAQAATIKTRLEVIQRDLDSLQPVARTGRTILIDDESLAPAVGKLGVQLLLTKTGHGENPAGPERGQKNDPGDFDRLPNISRGRYTWWDSPGAADLLAYQPATKGKFRIWLSWGCGFETHATDAEYWLDADGNLDTREDQTKILTANQKLFARGEGKTVAQPRWSGFVSAEVQELKPESTIVLRGGKTGTAVTADVIMLEEVTAENETPEPNQPSLRPPVQARENTERFTATTARFVRFTVLATNSAEPCIDELEVFSCGPVAEAIQNVARQPGVKITTSGNYVGNPIHRWEHLNDGKYGNSFSWISNTAGKGWVQFELAKAVEIDRIVWGRDREEKYKDRTAIEYRIEVADEPNAWQVVASSDDRLPTASNVALGSLFGLSAADRARAGKLVEEQRQLTARMQTLSSTAAAYAGRFGTPAPTHRLFRGDPMQPREQIAPDGLSVLGKIGLKVDVSDADRRAALAKWIISPNNPLTPRVIVNRLWQHHFGTGIVDTPSDFGVNGSQPSHPELLDWLATELIANSWSLKKLHRQILLTKTYQQSHQPSAAGLQADAQNRLLWRYPQRRLEAEIIRDSMLSAAGTLNLEMGGPGWSPFKPNSNYVRFYDPKDEFGPVDWRRAIYMTKIRMRQDGVFGLFDCPDAGQIAPKRSRSTTALQALSLFNSPFVLQQSEKLAERLKREAADDAVQVQRAFHLTLGRGADAEEVAAAKDLVAKHGLPALCRALFNANEFLFIP